MFQLVLTKQRIQNKLYQCVGYGGRRVICRLKLVSMHVTAPPPPLTGSALGWVMELFGGGRLFVARGEFNDEALLFLIVAVSAEDDGAL